MWILSSTLISEVGKCLYEPLKRHCGYLCCYSRNVDNLSEEVKNLCIKSGDVDSKLEEASRSQREPLEVVKDWKENVENIAGRADSLREKLHREQKHIDQTGCCCYPNFICSRYKLGKDAARELDRVKKLSDDLNSYGTELTYCPRPSAVTFIRTDTIQTNESITTVEEQIKQALADHNIRSIGIHGMGGIGKTTLVTKINNDMKDSNDIFDKVIMVTVSQNPDLKVIQGDIAERLGLNIKENNTVDHRANLLVKELKKYEYVLIILDNVWQKLEMVRVGIPRIDEHPCCKIIITTRNREVCDGMGMDKKIDVQPWSEENSRKLFESKVGLGIVSKNPELERIANEIVKECGGSPLAIVTFASALVGNQNEALWKEALRSLRSPDPRELEEIMKPVIISIRFSYNNLSGEGLKLCLLFCSLFPEDYEIDLFDLRTYGIGEGFLRVDGSLYEAWGKLESYIERLKARNLLLDCDKKNRVKMHDVVRDVARFIASKEHGFKETSWRGIHEWPMFDNAKAYKHMSLMKNNIRVLPNSSNMLELRTLLMQGNRKLDEIPDTFFEGMNLLVNLDLSQTELSRLPLSISFLTGLRTLQLSYDSETIETDVPLLGKLKNLEILILKGRRLKDTKELAALTKLKVLHLDQGLQSLPTGVLSKLIYLEELHLNELPITYSPYFRHEGDDNCANFQEEVDNCAKFCEVASLKCLTKLRVAVKSMGIVAQDIPIYWNYDNLHEFNIRVCNHLTRGASYSKYLFCDELSYPIPKWIKCLLEKTEALQVRMNNDFKRIPHLDGMDSLKHLNVEEWAVMEHVANIEFFPQATNTMRSLESLHLERLAKLERIIQGKVQNGFLMNLKTLEISKCEKILTILPFDVLQALQSLESIYVEDCTSLTHLVSTVEAGISMPNITLEQVSSLLLYDLPNFISFCNGPIPTRFLTNLKVLSIKNCGKFTINILSHELVQSLEPLEDILLENIDGAEVLFDFMSSNSVPPYALERLKKLFLKRIMMMKNLFSNERATERGGLLPRLEKLTLDDLPNFVSIYTHPSQVEELGNLQTLCVREIGKLQSLEEAFVLNVRLTMANESGPSGVIFRNLMELEVSRCHNLKNLFTLSMTQKGLQNLRILEVYDCNKLKWIIGNEDEGLVPSTERFLCHLRILRLKELPELMSFFYLDSISRSFTLPPSMSMLTITRCSKLGLKQHSSSSPAFSSIMQQQQQEEHKGLMLFENETLLNFSSSYSTTPFFLMQKGNSSLEVLYIGGLNQNQQVLGFEEGTFTTNLPKCKSIVAGYHISFEIFANLYYLDIRECHSLTGYLLSPTLTRRLQHLNKPENEDYNYSYSMDQKVLPILPKLDSLRLVDLPNLEGICPRGCTCLEIFGNLRYLYVFECNNLRECLLSPILVRSLQCLEILHVESCHKLENILVLSDKDEDSYSDLVVDEKKNNKVLLLPQLERIFLEDLPELASFYGDGDPNSFQLPSMKKITIKKCSKLRHLPLGPDNAPKLKKLIEEEHGFEVLNNGRLWRSRLDSNASLI